MEFFGFALLLLALLTVFLPWINYFSIRNLRKDIEYLQESLKFQNVKEYTPEAPAEPVPHKSYYQPKPEYKPAPLPAASNLPPRVEAEEAFWQEEAETGTPKSVFIPRVQPLIYEEEKEPVSTPLISFEQNIGTKLSVWLGAVALIFAAFYMVKYSIDQGLLSPAVRLSLSGLFGAALIAGGQWLVARPHIANAQRIAQGLVGAGVVALYVCLYAGINLYHLISPAIAFGGMATVTAVAVVMSLRHGQPIAVFGIIGGLLTPMMVSSDAPNAPLLFAYLFVLYAGILSILVRRQWWKLALLMLVGTLGWAALWLSSSFQAADSLPLVIFACGVCGVSLLAAARKIHEEGQSPYLHGFNLLAMLGASLVVCWVAFKVELSMFDWAMLELISLAVITLAFFRPEIYRRAVWAKMLLDLALFALWVDKAETNSIAVVLSYLAIIYMALPLWMMRRTAFPFFWAAVQSIFAPLVFLVTYWQLKTPGGDHFDWGSGAFFLSVLFIGLTSRTVRLFQDDRESTAVYAMAASFFISTGMVIILPSSYLPLAFAAQILATILIYKVVAVESLKLIAFVLAGVFTAMNYGFIMLFAKMLGTSLTGDHYRGVPNLMADVGLKLWLPALLTGAAYVVLTRFEESAILLRRILLAITLLLASAYIYIFVRSFFHPNDNIFVIEAGFIERSVITLLFALVSCALFYLYRTREWPVLPFAKIGVLLTLFRLTYFDLFLHNPYLDSTQFLGDTPILHGGTLTYGMGALVCAFMAYANFWDDQPVVKKAARGLGIVFLFALSSITVTQFFRGGFISKPPMSDMELYGYSVAWLLTGIALLALGIVKGSKLARMASLCFILLTVVKVFLIDASELKDLYRVFSFLGLGASLIGLSFFYSRYVFGKEK